MDKKIISTTKDATNKHIDPRTGLIQQGPSEMGTKNALNNNNSSPHRSLSPAPQVVTNSRGLSPSTNGNNSHQTQPSADKDDDRPSPLSRHRQTAVTTNGRLQTSNQQNGQLRNQVNSSSIVDSGYGSLDKLRTPSTDLSNLGATAQTSRGHIGGSPYLSPVLSRRAKPAFNPPQSQSREYSARKPSGLLMRNQDLVESREIEREEDEEGFVHLSNSVNNTRERSSSRKDTAYDRFVNAK